MSVVTYNNVIIGERDALRSDQLRFEIYTVFPRLERARTISFE